MWAFVRSLPIRLLIALLENLRRIVQRIILSRPFRWVLMPVIYVGLIVYVLRLAAGRTPRIQLPPDSPRAQEVAKLIAQLEASRKAPIQRRPLTEGDLALVKSLTWGTAGVAIVILVAIVTSTKTFGPAMLIAAGCFAVIVPLLTAFGFAHMHQLDPTTPACTTQECINLFGLIYACQLLFAVGLGALLWDFNAGVSIAYFVACYLGRRVYNNFVLHRVSPPPVESATTILKPHGVDEAHQAAANDPTGAASTDSPDATIMPSR